MNNYPLVYAFRKKNARYVNLLLLHMKLIIGLIVLFVSTSAANVSGQQVTLRVQSATLAEVMGEIRKQTGYNFVYRSTPEWLSTKVSVDLRNTPLEHSLALIFDQYNIDYKIKGRSIALLPRAAAPAIGAGASATTQQSIRGEVRNPEGEPIVGAVVQIKGGTNKVPTDDNGNFSITGSVGDVLVISYLGYEASEHAVRSLTSNTIVLQPSSTMLEEAVISIGYGTTKKSDVTGSIASVSGADLESVVLTSPDKALQGRAAGVNVRASSHAPGGGISVNVRGSSSITASGQPLYVVDGFPVSTNFFRPNNVNEGGDTDGNPLAAIDAANIESIEVLKDASATAIYGSRGANGVVIITTKRGRTGKPKIVVESLVGVRQVSKKYDFLTGSEYAQLLNEAELLDGNAPIFTAEQIKSFGKGTNWQNEVFRVAPSQRHRVNVSGGTEDIKYMVNTTYDDQDGIILGTGFKKFSTNVNLDARLSKKFKFGASFNVANNSEQQVRNDTKGSSNWPSMVMNIFRAPLHIPARNADGTPTDFTTFQGGTTEENPIYMAEYYDINTNTVRMLGSMFADYDITDELTFRTRVGLDYRDWRNKYFYPINSRSARATLGEAGQYANRTSNILNENLLEYNKPFNERHTLNVLLGMTYQRENSEILSASAYGFPTDFYKYNNLGIATTPLPGNSNRTQWTLLSYLGRVNYNFDERFLLTATARIDGSSKFGRNNKYGFFPSAAFAWRMIGEEFIQDMDLFSDLKLRLGYGHTGNEGIGMYNSISTMDASRAGAGAYVFNNQVVTIAYPRNMPNPDLTWEKARDINIGLDMAFLNNRISASIDAYHKKTHDLLLEVPLPAESGYDFLLQNLGSMENKGIEFVIQTQNMVNAFQWNTNFNLAFNRNKVLDLGGSDYLFTGWVGGNLHSHNGTNVVRLAPGQPIGAFYGSVYEGIWRSAEEIAQVGTMPSALPGSMRFKDTNKDGIYNADDDQYIGNPNPKFSFGMTNSFSYKQFSLNVMLYGEFGQDVLWLTKKRLAGGLAPVAKDRRMRWTPENPNREGVTLAANQIYPSTVSTNNTYDGSFLRISNISLSYLLKQSQLGIRGIESVRFTLTADNPFIFTNYPGYDPEINAYGNSNVVKGMDKYGYPSSRYYSFGLTLSF